MGDLKCVENESSTEEGEESFVHVETLSAVSQLPLVGQVVNKAKNVYGTVKESHQAVNTVLNVAEGTLKVVATVGGPVICSTIGCLAAATIPGAGAALNAVMNANQIQPVVGVVCAVAQLGVKKLFRRRRR